MSFYPYPSLAEPTVRKFWFIQAFPSPLVDLIQTPVWLYLWIFVPMAYAAFWLLIFSYLISLPFPHIRKKVWAFLGKLTFKNMLTMVPRLEEYVLKSNWRTFFYIVLFGTPLVAILCVLYGHHPLSFSPYDSPFQAFAQMYGFLFFIVPLVITQPINIPLPVLPLFALLITLIFWCILLISYILVLLKGISPLIRLQMLSIALFTVAQPFIFRFLRDFLPQADMNAFFGYNSAYLIAFFLPCIAYALGGMIVHWYEQKKIPAYFFGMHAGLLFLAILAADLH